MADAIGSAGGDDESETGEGVKRVKRETTDPESDSGGGGGGDGSSSAAAAAASPLVAAPATVKIEVTDGTESEIISVGQITPKSEPKSEKPEPDASTVKIDAVTTAPATAAATATPNKKRAALHSLRVGEVSMPLTLYVRQASICCHPMRLVSHRLLVCLFCLWI